MAGSLNKVQIIGRLGNDPKLTYLPSGQPVAEMSVATDESYKDKSGNKIEKTEWHNVSVYGRSAEFCDKYLSKGRLVYIEGMLRTRKWQKDGQDHYSTEVTVNAPGHRVQGLDKNPDSNQSGGNSAQNRGNSGRGSSGGDDNGPAFPSEAGGMDDVLFAVILAPLAAIGLAFLSSGGALA